MPSVIPKGQQTAYEQWEMASFGAPPGEPAAAVDLEPEASSVGVGALLAEAREQIAAAREQARREGLAEGLAQGYQAGMEQGRVQAAQENTILRQLTVAFGADMTAAKELVAQELLDLALDLSKAMLKTVLEIQPARVLPVVADAVTALPFLQYPAVLYLHPEDAMLVRERMRGELPDAGWRIVEEAGLDRGDCRIKTPTNQVDAGAQSRWHRIAASLGKDGKGLE